MMEKEINNSFDGLIEKIIFSYRGWWQREDKEKMQNLLLRVLKTKYENRSE